MSTFIGPPNSHGGTSNSPWPSQLSTGFCLSWLKRVVHHEEGANQPQTNPSSHEGASAASHLRPLLETPSLLGTPWELGGKSRTWEEIPSRGTPAETHLQAMAPKTPPRKQRLKEWLQEKWLQTRQGRRGRFLLASETRYRGTSLIRNTHPPRTTI